MSNGPVPAKRYRPLLSLVLLCATQVGALSTAASAMSDQLAGLAASSSAFESAAHDESLRVAWWNFLKPQRPPIYESQPHNVTPHPAVARIIVPERGATSFGSGTLVDVREKYGLVVTNWHVVQDAQGHVEVTFPGGFRSHARPLKVDSNWDLAALVIWRPPIEPVKLARQPPRPGDLLTIHGYGRGQYRIATGRCTTYYAPRMNYPMEMVELDVEARQGDSGGPIFNDRGELAGVLFGAGQGTTLGSYAPRVSNFLATLAPDIGQVRDQELVAVADRPAPNVEHRSSDYHNSSATKYPNSLWTPPQSQVNNVALNEQHSSDAQASAASGTIAAVAANDSLAGGNHGSGSWYDALKSALAVVGLVAIAAQLVKVVR